ncbi:MAG: hypothetical protein WCX65_06685 [bacterium]
MNDQNDNKNKIVIPDATPTPLGCKCSDVDHVCNCSPTTATVDPGSQTPAPGTISADPLGSAPAIAPAPLGDHPIMADPATAISPDTGEQAQAHGGTKNLSQFKDPTGHAARLTARNKATPPALNHGLRSAGASGPTFFLRCSAQTCIKNFDNCITKPTDPGEPCTVLVTLQDTYFSELSALRGIRAAVGEPDRHVAQSLAAQLTRRDYIFGLLNLSNGGLTSGLCAVKTTAARLYQHLTKTEDRIVALTDKLLLTPAARQRGRRDLGGDAISLADRLNLQRAQDAAQGRSNPADAPAPWELEADPSAMGED